jgi:Zn-dependent protease
MQSALRVGRVGPLNLYLNYTWIFAALLILWWAALLWLPDNFPGRTTIFYWLIAVIVLLGFLISVILHELVHSAIARSGPRNANLFPFGAAVPFRPGHTSPGRIIAAALAGIIFNLALGGSLFALSTLVTGGSSFELGLRASLTLLGWVNIALGAVNLIPGIPFDGGWVLAGAFHWFTNDPDSGMRIAQSIGAATTIALVLAGAWRGLTSDAWLQALALVVLAWAAHEAGAIGRQRGLMRRMLDQLVVGAFMEKLRPDAAVPAGASVADFVRAHPHHPPNSPLPIVEEGGNLVGVTTLDEAEKLLQGTWPTTPVRSIAFPVNETRILSPDDTITNALALAESAQEVSSDNEPMRIPVLSGGRMVGALDPGVLGAFRDAGSEFGVEEAVASVPVRGGIFSLLGALLPFLFLLVGAAILGNMALRADPDELRDVIPPAEDDRIILSNFKPTEGGIIGLGPREISAQAEADSAIISATLSVDGEPLDTQIMGAEILTKTVTAQMPGLTLGIHTARIIVSTESGARRAETWDFRVAPGGDDTPIPATTPTAPPTSPSPTAQPAARLQVVRYTPPSGGRVLANAESATLVVEVSGQAPPASAIISVDSVPAGASVISPVDTSEGRYRISAEIGGLAPGTHVARLEMTAAGGGFYSTEWTFVAREPDANNVYFSETRFFVSQPILAYWQANGGLARFGYPISDELTERVDGSEETYRAQYFERARLEVHARVPSSAGDVVVLGRAGALLRTPQPPAEPRADARFFPETGHNLGGVFLGYWESNGGLASFGFPITEELVERNPADGKDYTVQYFERARFEYHPEAAGTPAEVQLGLLGRQLYNKLYGAR